MRTRARLSLTLMLISASASACGIGDETASEPSKKDWCSAYEQPSGQTSDSPVESWDDVVGPLEEGQDRGQLLADEARRFETLANGADGLPPRAGELLEVLAEGFESARSDAEGGVPANEALAAMLARRDIQTAASEIQPLVDAYCG